MDSGLANPTPAPLDEPAAPAIVRDGEATLRVLAEPYTRFLGLDGVTDVCVNRPGVVWVSRFGRWERHSVPALAYTRLENIAVLAAGLTNQDVGPYSPICRTILPDGQRVLLVVPPCADAGHVVLSARKPADFSLEPERLEADGVFDGCRRSGDGTDDTDARLKALLDAGRWMDFLKAAVLARKNIGITGATGSGKTTLLNSLTRFIPREERLFSIEDTFELKLEHENVVRTQYSKGGQGSSKVGSVELLEAALRAFPSRILQGEISDEAAFTYVRTAAAGHPGSIATWHAKNARVARDALAMMFRQHEAARTFTDDTVTGYIRQFVEVVVHMERRPGEKPKVKEILFDPA